MVRALLLVLLFLAAPAWGQDYRSKDLDAAAQNWRRELLESIPATARQPGLIAALSGTAAADLAAGRFAPAVEELRRVIANGGEGAAVWLQLAQAELGAHDEHAMASAWNAYTQTADPNARAAALFVIARDLDGHDKQQEALAAFEAGLKLAADPAVAERVQQLRRLVMFRVTRLELAAEADEARACFRFNRALAARNDLSTFVRSDPPLDGIVTARADMLCLDGLKHGGVYQVRLLAGMPAAGGETLPETVATRIVVPDRKPSVRFAGTGYVLPREGTPGLPVTTINVAKLRLKLLRVNERNLVPALDADKLTLSFSADDIQQVIDDTGSLVWQGEMAISGPRNRPVATAIPLKDMLRDTGPGIYLAVAERADLKPGEGERPATNWVLVSDLGLTAYKGADGLSVDVRSLHDATPLPGVMVRLYAHNNGELASVATGADGIAHIPAGLLRGRGGDEAYVVTAYGTGGDFNFLEISRAAFDLSDRGVGGRAPPGPVDAYLYTDRGIYRPGESVHLVALVRDDKAVALADLPVTMRLLRPDGIEVERRQLRGGHLGGYDETIALPRDARIGDWRVELVLDPKAPPIGSAAFRVEDFVPPQLKVALSAADAPIRPGQSFPVAVDAAYYYGAPGAGLAVEAEAVIALDDNPYPTHPGYSFGLAGEEFTSTRRDLAAPTTDAQGKASVPVLLNDLPDRTRPLAATIRIGVIEPSGRAVGATITRAIRQRALAIGLRSPAGDDAVPEGSPATLEVIAVDPGGQQVAAGGLRYELLRETWDYQWYAVNGLWRYHTVISDHPVAAGSLDVPADKPAALSRQLPSGRYRWEVSDPKSGARSSLRFRVGWWVEAELPEVPDKLEATFDKKSYRAGDTAKLFIKASFAGDAEVAIASDHVLSLRRLSLPAGGTTLDIPVGADWGSGVYALVSAYRATTAPPRHAPGRAVGVAWLALDPAPRTLSVVLSAPKVVRPRAAVEVPVKVAGLAPGAEAYVTLAAVDEAVLTLTDFASPQPEQYYYGKRRLGVELRDLYGRLIDTTASTIGVLRSGGDSFAKRSVAGLPDKSSKVVALFSGVVRLGADGTARIPLAIPDFEGQLRLMAVAFAKDKLGSASAAMTVRDPVVTIVSLPRFLAPGDTARIPVAIDNLEGPPGDYRLTMSAAGAAAFRPAVSRTVTLAAGGRFADAFPLTATTIGNAVLKLDLSGPAGFHITRDFTLGVRPAQAYQLRRFVGRLQPGESVTLDDGAADAFLQGTAEALLSVSPHPEWDVPGLLRALDRYPYGCIEQTTSRAMPLLYVEDVARLWHTDAGASAAAALDQAIGHIAELQRSDGSFGVWSDSGDTVPWLDAYATDFLLRARERGRNVPDLVLNSAISWLHDYVRQEHAGAASLPALAYAHYVLARANADDLPALRYFADTRLMQLPTALARAQLAAALAQYGDTARAKAAYDAALAPMPARAPALRYVEYGSELRDDAAVLAIAGADPALQPRLTAVVDRIQELFAKAGSLSTQEEAWLLLAAEAAAKAGGGSMTVAEGSGAPQTRTAPLYLRRAIGGGLPAQTITNRGTAAVWRSVSITGVPRAGLPAESRGYSVTRKLYHPDGSPADPAQARQSDLYVVVIEGHRADSGRAAQTLVVDLLPAGFEIETATLSKGKSTADYSWLPDLTAATYSEARDDRFIAAIDMAQGASDFTLAYIVRAVSAGSFAYPALVAEDMYDPETRGRTAPGTLAVAPR